MKLIRFSCALCEKRLTLATVIIGAVTICSIRTAAVIEYELNAPSGRWSSMPQSMQHKFREVVTEKEHMLSDKLEALFRYRFLLSACCLKWRNDTAFVCERFIGTSKQREARS